MKACTSSTSKTERLLTFTETEMKKEERSLSGEDITVTTRDGRLSILIRLPRNQLLDTAKNGVCISTDSST
jgi:hypothetical protein